MGISADIGSLIEILLLFSGERFKYFLSLCYCRIIVFLSSAGQILIGNIHNTSLDVIVKDVEWNMIIKKLVHQDSSSFFSLLKQAGLAHKIKPSYTNICRACSEPFNVDEVTRVIKNNIFDVRFHHLFEDLNDLTIKEVRRDP